MLRSLLLAFTLSTASAQARRKILCLHGGGQSASSFRDYSTPELRAAFPDFDFVFPDAPDGNLWMRDPPGGKGAPTTDPNWDAGSLRLLDSIVERQGPFHGILGYSQGGAYVSAYLAHAPAGTFAMALIFCGYLPTTHQGIMARINAASPFSTRTLVFIGERDTTIAPSMSVEAAARYTSATVVRSRNTGHALPARADPTFQDVVRFMGSSSSAPPVEQTHAEAAGSSTSRWVMGLSREEFLAVAAAGGVLLLALLLALAYCLGKRRTCAVKPEPSEATVAVDIEPKPSNSFSADL